MTITLLDGSVVGDGSQIGMFPVLADQLLEKPSTLLRTSTNPRMDLVLLIVKDASSASSGTATAPPGMSAAQFALVQRMLAARQRGAAQAAGGQGSVPEPKRGPQIHLVLWRIGDDSSVVWSVSLSFDKIMDLAPTAPGASQQEHEDAHLHDIAWSPKGDRVGVLASVRRSPVASTSTAHPRTATFLRTYSVQDGRLLSAVQVGQPSNSDDFATAMTLQWLDIDYPTSEDVIDGSSESLLTKLPPLPTLPAAETFASAGGSGNLMPHQLRMMQMSGQKPPPSFQFPSHLALQGRGPLAKIPHLAKLNADLGLIEGGDAALVLDEDCSLPLSPESVVLVSQGKSGQVNLVLDGQINIGALELPHDLQESQEATDGTLWSSRIVSLSPDMTRLTSICASANTSISYTNLSLPLSPTTNYGPTSVRRCILAITRSSHLLRFYLGYALDSASALQQVYQKEFVSKVTSEWTKNIDDLSMKFGGDMKYELINVLLTGRAGPAAEQFLLGNLTEGVLSRLEQNAHTALYMLKKLIGESLRPGLERCIVCLSGLLGQVRFFGKEEKGLEETLRMLQAALGTSLDLAEEVDMEAVVSQEFYRWCRTERERQERIKQDQDEPRLPITYDVGFVANYIERGFENEALQKMLGSKDVAEDQTLSGIEGKASLQENLARARAFLASRQPDSTVGERNMDDSTAQSKTTKEGTIAIVPKLTTAIEKLADQLALLLDGALDSATVLQNISTTPVASGAVLATDPPTALSLSSSAEVTQHRILSTSFTTSETVLSAYILSTSPASILVIRADAFTSTLSSAHFTIPSSSSSSFSSVEPLKILDIGFYGELELLVLASLPSTSTSVLLAFNLSDLPFTETLNNDNGLATTQVTPARATEFEPDFQTAKIAVNPNKQTVTVLDEVGKRVVYLDVSSVEMVVNDDSGTGTGGDVVMTEDG